MNRWTILFILVFVTCATGFAQVMDDSNGLEDQKDISDLFKRIHKVDNEQVETMKLYLPIFPLVGYMPANGFIIGAAALPSICLDSVEHTRMSSMMANVQLTSKKQVNFNVRSNVYLSRDKWILQGDWRFLFYSQPTYGLGIYDFEDIDNQAHLNIGSEGDQPMRFNYLRLYQKGYKKLFGKLYGGVGIAFDSYSQILDLNLEVDTSLFTSHYIYSTTYGYDINSYKNLGYTINVLLDDRDNSMNTYSGSYLDLSYRFNWNFFNNSSPNSKVQFDFRHYLSLTKEINPHIIAIWLLGDIQITGNAPYLSLPSVGWDTYNRSGRGFVQGRYRGDNFLYAETEYRFPILRNGLLGGVAFINALSVSSSISNQSLLQKCVVGYGGGLRVKVNKLTRVNLCIDFAIGPQKEGLIFFGLQEVF